MESTTLTSASATEPQVALEDATIKLHFKGVTNWISTADNCLRLGISLFLVNWSVR